MLTAIGARAKEKEEEEERSKANERYASSSYQPTFGSTETANRHDSSGPPWGHIPVEYGVRLNRNKPESSTQGASTNNASQNTDQTDGKNQESSKQGG
jgi:hypothetical protein